MRKLNDEVKQAIREACLVFENETSHNVANLCAGYAINLLENIDKYPHWFDEERANVKEEQKGNP